MLGAEPTSEGVRYSVWAPGRERIEVEVQSTREGTRVVPLERQPSGHHQATDPQGRAGDAYKFRVDGAGPFPDPASHGQSDTVHGASVVVDAARYEWRDAEWQRPPFRDLVIYELHIGTFTEEGTFRSAIEKLPHLRDLGITAIEIMPIGDFPGRWNWGYDGVLIYAPARAYGSPDDLRALVDAAHQHGLAVILDVVYNHFGPDGNYLSQYSRAFFNEKNQTPWGAALNFDGARSEAVRDFFIRNPIYWMEQFHFDGFRFDATHAITDSSDRHVFAEMTAAIHARGGYAIAEDSRNQVRLLLGEEDRGYGFDGVWADDFHHVARVGQTGAREAYFQDFEGTLGELIDTLRHGWLYRGQPSRAAGKKRGAECRHVPPSKFVHCLSNHDQTGNRAFGERLHASISPEAYRALSMLLCLTPYTPMLFMGQEWAASTPFLYFTDHNEELAPLITEGRRKEFAEFAEFRDPAARKRIPDPQSEETFLRSKLKWCEVGTDPHARVLALYRECLRLRREVPAFRPKTRDTWEAAELAFGVGAIRFKGEGADYLLAFDFDGGHAGSIEEEHLASLRNGEQWEVVLSSEEARFGGDGAPCYDADTRQFSFTKPEAVLLRSLARSP